MWHKTLTMFHVLLHMSQIQTDTTNVEGIYADLCIYTHSLGILYDPGHVLLKSITFSDFTDFISAPKTQWPVWVLCQVSVTFYHSYNGNELTMSRKHNRACVLGTLALPVVWVTRFSPSQLLQMVTAQQQAQQQARRKCCYHQLAQWLSQNSR